MTRLAVLADPHCDDFGSKIDAATGLNARWVDTVGMVRWVAEDAAKRGADALIVAGDLTEGRHPAPWRVAQIGKALGAFGGPVKLLRGNHDGERAGMSIVNAIAEGRPGWDGFTQPGITLVGDVAIAMLPYVDRAWLRTQPDFAAVPDADVNRVLAEQYLTIARGLYVAAQGVASRTVLVVHQALSGGAMSDSQRAFLGDQGLVVDSAALGAIGFDAILAGHFHKHQFLQGGEDGINTVRPIVYAGSPYRTDFGEEHQEKGYLIVDNSSTIIGIEFVVTPARRFVTWDLDLPTGLQPQTRDLDDAVVRLINVDAGSDLAELRRLAETAGAWDVQEIRTKPVDVPEVVGGIDESLAPEAALEEYFAGDPDRDALVELGRELLEAVR